MLRTFLTPDRLYIPLVFLDDGQLLVCEHNLLIDAM